MHLILASASPRRCSLLQALGLDMEVIPSRLAENFAETSSTPQLVVEDLARQKAQDVTLKLAERQGQFVVLAADTLVVLDGELLGKPANEDAARDMLMKLSGCSHQVYTGISLVVKTESGDLREMKDSQRSTVTLRHMKASEINAYVATGEPMDKAGAYALQGIGAAFVERIEGCYTNVIGLPIPKVVSMLRQAGIGILGLPSS